MGLKEFMGESKVLNRWAVAGIFLTGMLAGVLLGIIYGLIGIVR